MKMIKIITWNSFSFIEENDGKYELYLSDVSMSFIPAGWHPGAKRQEMKNIQSSGDGQVMIEAERRWWGQ